MMSEGVNARDVRAPKSKESEGAAFLRPVIQKAVTRVIRNLVSGEVLSWPEVIDRISSLDWRIGAAPWIAVFNPTNSKMITAKENVELLDELFEVHLAAASKQAIIRARKSYKEIRGQTYPVSEEFLQKGIVAGERKHVPTTGELAVVTEEHSTESSSVEEDGEAG